VIVNFSVVVVCYQPVAMADRDMLVLLERVRVSGHKWVDMERIVSILRDNWLKASASVYM
jgi:hypothetical protein